MKKTISLLFFFILFFVGLFFINETSVIKAHYISIFLNNPPVFDEATQVKTVCLPFGYLPVEGALWVNACDNNHPPRPTSVQVSLVSRSNGNVTQLGSIPMISQVKTSSPFSGLFYIGNSCIITGPADGATLAGETATFNLIPSGMGGVPSFLSDNPDCGTGGTLISSSCNSSMCTFSCTYSDAGSYSISAQIQSGAKSASCSSQIRVVEPGDSNCVLTNNEIIYQGDSKTFIWSYSNMGNPDNVTFKGNPVCGNGAAPSGTPSCSGETCTFTCNNHSAIGSQFIHADIENIVDGKNAECSNYITVVSGTPAPVVSVGMYDVVVSHEEWFCFKTGGCWLERTEERNMISVSDCACPTGSNWVSKDGICIDSTKEQTIYSVADCPAGSVEKDGICISSTVAPAPVNGVCGTANKIYPFDGVGGFGSDTFCEVGTPSPANPTFPTVYRPTTTWVCSGLYGGAPSSNCVATLNVICGNNIIEGAEECDGTADSACPGNCGSVATEDIEFWTSKNETSWGSGSTNNQDPYNTYNHDSRAQFIVLSSELTELGFQVGDIITGVSLKTAYLPGRTNLANFRIRMKPTTETTTNSWQGGWVDLFGPTNVARNTLTANQWKKYAVLSGGGFFWDGNNIMFDISRDDNNRISGGGLYKRDDVGTSRMFAGNCQSTLFGGLKLHEQTSGTFSGSVYNYVPSLKITRIPTNSNQCKCPINIPPIAEPIEPTLDPCGQNATFKWEATGQESYQLQISTSDTFDETNIIFDSGMVNYASDETSRSFTLSTDSTDLCKDNINGDGSTGCNRYINYDETYHWRVKVW